MARPKIYKRRYFIQKKFQGKFILVYALSVSTVVALATWLLYRQIEGAVEKHLYRTHIKIAKTGDFLVDLLFLTNFYTILAVVVTVLIVSLLIFRGITRSFKKMDETVDAMSRGDFNKPYRPGWKFAEIGNLGAFLEEARTINQARFTALGAALKNLEAGIAKPGNVEQLQKAKAQLNTVLSDISLT